jgi:hypothetical protein
MCKKLGVTALVIVAALFLLHKLDLLGYGKVMWNKVKHEAKLSPEMQLERLKVDVKDLDEPISKQRTAIANELAKIDALAEDVTRAKANLKDREEKLTLLRDALKRGTDGFVKFETGEKVSREKVEDLFTRKFEEFKAAEAAVKAKEELLASRKEKVEVAQQHLATMQSKQRELKAKVEKAELDLAKLREAHMQNDMGVDDSKFADVVNRLDDVKTQISAQKKVLEMKTAADTDAVVEKAIEQKAQTKKAIEQWDERVSANAKPTEKVTQKD